MFRWDQRFKIKWYLKGFAYNKTPKWETLISVVFLIQNYTQKTLLWVLLLAKPFQEHVIFILKLLHFTLNKIYNKISNSSNSKALAAIIQHYGPEHMLGYHFGVGHRKNFYTHYLFYLFMTFKMRSHSTEIY